MPPVSRPFAKEPKRWWRWGRAPCGVASPPWTAAPIAPACWTKSTARGIARTGWGAGCCVGDFDNDGYDDLFVSYWGDCSLWKNLGNGKFVDVAAKAGVTTRTTGAARRNNTGCAFVDYDKDGHLDLFVSNYLEFDTNRPRRSEEHT